MKKFQSLVYQSSKDIKNVNALPKYGEDVRVFVINEQNHRATECSGNCVSCKKNEWLVFINNRGGSGNVPTPQI